MQLPIIIHSFLQSRYRIYHVLIIWRDNIRMPTRLVRTDSTTLTQRVGVHIVITEMKLMKIHHFTIKPILAFLTKIDTPLVLNKTPSLINLINKKFNSIPYAIAIEQGITPLLSIAIAMYVHSTPFAKYNIILLLRCHRFTQSRTFQE